MLEHNVEESPGDEGNDENQCLCNKKDLFWRKLLQIPYLLISLSGSLSSLIFHRIPGHLIASVPGSAQP